MTTRNIYRKTYLGPAPYVHLRPYDSYQKVAHGGNSPVVNGKRVYTENGYTSDVEILRNPPCRMRSPGYAWVNGAMFTLGAKPESDSPIVFPTAYDALPKLHTKWKESQFDLGVSAGEGKEAWRMMADRLGSLARAANAIRKGDLQDALRHMLGQVPSGAKKRAQQALNSRDITGAWLETQLGWLPTVNDIYNAAEHVKFVPSSRNRIKAAIVTKTGVRAANYTEPKFEVRGSTVFGTSVIIDVYRRPTEIERLGLTNPPGVIYNLTSGSWLVDYFLPIGEALEKMSAVGQLPVQKVIVTQFSKMEGRTRITSYSGEIAGVQVQPDNSPTAVAVARVYHVDRQIGGSLHDVISAYAWAPNIGAPSFDLSTRQMMNTLAVATNALNNVMGAGMTDRLRRFNSWRRRVSRNYTE